MVKVEFSDSCLADLDELVYFDYAHFQEKSSHTHRSTWGISSHPTATPMEGLDPFQCQW